MAAEDELLKLLEPAIRQRIEADYDRFAPLLALLGAWQEEVEGHVAQTEQNTVIRLMGELFPKGYWKFPHQALLVPEDLARREIGEDLVFTDRATQTPWTACGPGGTLPTRLENWRVEREGWDRCALVCDIRLESRQPNAHLLLPPAPPEDPYGQAQIAFVGASEAIVGVLASAPWAVQHPGEPFVPVGVTRYQGYLDFEQGLGAARGKQRQLETWLPPFYPYGRKFLRFYLPAPASNTPPDAFAWLETGGSPLRLAALIDEDTADYFDAHKDTPPLILNAIPVAQMKTASEPLIENPDRVGDGFAVPFMGYKNCFAATAREVRATTEGFKTSYHPVRLMVAPSEEGRGMIGTQNLTVMGDRPASAASEFRVRIYHECYGEQAAQPRVLTRPNGTRFSVPFPAVGGMDSSIMGYDDPGARRSWYQSLLRAPQLTQGDVLEILTQIPACARYLDLDPNYFSLQLDIENKPWIERTPWDNYLWPCLVSESSLLEQRATYLTPTRVAVIPVMRLIFNRGRESLPDFLQEDLVRYAASVISQFFMIGWYRVVGKRADA